MLLFHGLTWMDDGTLLQRVKGINNTVTDDEYIRTVSICRIMLPNINNIQASWLTVGANIAQVCLHGGANEEVMHMMNKIKKPENALKWINNALLELLTKYLIL